MARPQLPQGARRSKWAVLNATPAERAAITAAASEAGLGISAYILACTARARVAGPAREAERLRLLTRVDAMLDAIARRVLASGQPLDAARVLLALHRIEAVLHGRKPASDPGGEKDAPC